VAGAVAFTGWATLARVEASYDREFDARVTSLLQAAARHYRARGERAARRVEALGRGLLENRDLAERLWIRPDPASPVVLEAARRLQRLSGLDLLEIVDGDGRILSSAHWFEQVGFSDEAAPSLPEGEPVLRRERLPDAEVLAVVARRTASLGGRRVFLVGGMRLGAAFLEEMSPGTGEAVLLFDDRGGPPLAAGATGRLRPESALYPAGLLRPDAEARGRVTAADGDEWAAGSLPLRDAAGERLGTLMAAIDPAERAALLRRLRLTFVSVGLAGALLAIGAAAWIARKITRPVADLVQGVEAIRAGRADTSFPRAGADEIGGLVESFSRLHRSLEAQQRRLLAAERVAAWKEVAQRVAHEVKNPLSPIRLAVENLIKARRRAPERFDAIFEEATRNILEEVDQLERIVTEFSEFARLPAPRPEPCDLDALVDQVLSLHAAEPGLRVRRERDGPLPSVVLDPEQVSRVLKNLVGNAVEAMRPAGGGELAVRTRRDGEAVLIELADTGPGFTPEAAGRMFEPYFTTKPKGTGLGLPIALRIVSDHGGILRVERGAAGGARVVVQLPVAGPATTDRGER
jgi:signal transduction histidine kinase